VPEVPRVTANLRDISLVGSQVGTAVGESGVILRTTDGGVTWVQQDGEIDGDIITVRFADAKRGIAGTSYGELLHTNNGGATWDCYTVPYGVRPYGYMVDVAYYDGVNAVVLALSNRLYRSTDGGFTWGWESYSILEGVYGADFLAPNVGTVVGEYGMILRTR
jgi:photosystem II stability/assembly factor-like uncharacterized protein